MPIQKLILAGLCFCMVLSGYCQNFPHFDLLNKKADSAYSEKSYSISAKYYEQAIHLPENQKPEIFGGIYYEMACVYSLNKDKQNALDYLEKSFSTYHLKKKSTPVSITDITSDSDLDFIRDEKRFQDLLNRYYPKYLADFINAKEVSYAMVLEYLMKSRGETFGIRSIRNKIIYWKKNDISYIFNDSRLPFPNIEDLRVNALEFINCTFKLNLIWDVGPKQEQKFFLKQLRLINCKFLGRFFVGVIDFVEPPYISRCDFTQPSLLGLNIDLPDLFSNGMLHFDSCKFDVITIGLNSKSNPVSFEFIGNTFKSTYSGLQLDKAVSGMFLNNNFSNGNFYLQIKDAERLKFEGNTFDNLIISDTKISQELDMQRSFLKGKFLLSKTYFTNDPVNDIDWEDIDSLRLGLLERGGDGGSYIRFQGKFSPGPQKLEFNSGETSIDISSKERFRELMGLYSMFLNLYKSKNDLESYNGCFIAVKELQSKRLKYLYDSQKTFEAYFSWKLSQLLKFYVRYGTKPARAIVISVYIIICFGIFFFFFPSDWDTTSKKKLIQNFKDFIQKNEKGYVVPFFVLIGGFALSLINALTLSLNAFITLGFGNIPTHGLARYVCVIEGFMGWFLLSIFTVALINQVL